MPAEGEELIIDHVIVVCKGCHSERTIWPDAPIIGAEQIRKFIDSGIPPCGCGATHCDLKLHLKGVPNVLTT